MALSKLPTKPDTNKYNWVMMLSGVTGTECKGFSGYQALEEAI